MSTTEVTVREPNAHLDLRVLTLGQISDIGSVFAKSGMFKDVRGQAQAITKIIAGQELGIPPMQAMQGYHIVEGQPRLTASLIGALVKRSGRYDYRIEESTAALCTLRWIQDGAAVGESSFTIEEAQAANLVKPGSGWAKYPADMLFARALTRGARRHCPEVFGGAVYVVGEEVDAIDQRPESVEAAIAQQSQPQRAPIAPTIGELEKIADERAAEPAADEPEFGEAE